MTGLAVRRSGLLDVPGPDLATHLHHLGGLPAISAARLLDEVERSGLTGRGGAGFPVHRKLRTVASGRHPVVVANGSEGEPASGKDVELMVRSPHLVLDGLQTAAHAVGARRAIAYVKPGPALTSLRRALDERRRAGGDAIAVELVPAQEGFVSGEESAVVRAIDGGPGLPRATPPRVFQKGVGGRPTLVQNVETLCHLALLTRYDADWFRQAGTADEPGTMLCTVSGEVVRPGVVEVALGTPVRDVLAAAGGSLDRLRGVLVGGYHGAWMTTQEAGALAMSVASLTPIGASPGAGVVLALGDGACPLMVSAGVVGYLAEQSARQCGPCLNGLPAMARALQALSGTRWSSGLVGRLEELVGLVDGRGACHHPNGTVRLVRSVLTTFPDELDAHAHGACLARSR